MTITLKGCSKELLENLNDCLYGYTQFMTRDTITLNEIDDLYQEPKTGRWIPTGYDGYADGYPVYDQWECSGCRWEHTGDEETLTPYCPNCGLKMINGGQTQ